jgi:hypothetical protein
MKARSVVLVAWLIATVAGCGIFGAKKPQIDIVGTWSGKGHDGSPATMIFREDGTVSIMMTVEGYNLSLVGKYTIDYTTEPVALDMRDIDLSEFGMVLYCPAIVAFPDPQRMTLYGMFAEYDGTARPTAFNPRPSQMGEIYLELTKEQ